jgi:hypothetical protein
MGVLPKCHTSSIKIPSRRTHRYNYDEDMIPHVTKILSKLTVLQLVSNCCYFLYKYFN